MSKKWRCEECGELLRTKTELVEHLRDEVEWKYQELQTVESQLNELGVEIYDIQ